MNKVKVRVPGDVVPLLGNIKNAEQECFVVICLDGNNVVTSLHIVTVGLVNQSMVHPRETFKWAIRNNAVSIILAHNHPSGSLEPSESDLQATKRICEVGKLVGIPVLDHILVGPEGWISIREGKPGCFLG